MPRDTHIEIESRAERRERFLRSTKLWEILEIALEDYDKTVADPRYYINMGTWYRNDVFDLCEVCLGGSVLVQTQEFGPDLADYKKALNGVANYSPLWYRICALNELRQGHVSEAYLQLHHAERNTRAGRDRLESEAFKLGLKNERTWERTWTHNPDAHCPNEMRSFRHGMAQLLESLRMHDV